MLMLPSSWANVLNSECEKPYFKKMEAFLDENYKIKAIYPKQEHIFTALELTPYEKVKVVILGQDPYHQKGQAHGLSFSVMLNVKTPPSLQNIYKELESDLGCYIPDNGNLISWAKQGVLLLNTVLTVEDSLPTSHKDLGWQTFTQKIMEELNKRKEPIIFLLWGAHAKAFKPLIDENKHYVLEAAHPSPFSAYNGFFGCRHFSKVNALLKLLKKEPINWQIENVEARYIQKKII